MADADAQAVTEWDEKGNPIKAQAAGVTEWDEHGNPVGKAAAPSEKEQAAALAAPTQATARSTAIKPLQEAAFGTPEGQASEKEMLDTGDVLGLSTALGRGSRALESKRNEAELGALRTPKPGYAAYTPAAGYDLAARAARMGSGLTSPKSIGAGIGLATAPEVAGPYMMGEGLYHGVKSTPKALQGDPEAAEEALGGYSEAAGGGAATLASPMLAERISPEARAARASAKSTREIKEAAPPGRHEINYDAQLERAKPYLAEEQRTAPVKSVREAHETANAAVKGIEDKIGSYIDQLPETERISGQDILDRATAKLNDPNSPRTPAERAAGMKALEEFLTDEIPPEEEDGEPTRQVKDLSVKETDRLRWRFNRDMDTEMGMTEADRADVRASNPKFAAKEAAAEAMRDAVYDKLEAAGVPGVREIRGDEGAVIQMRDAFRRNITRSEKSNAPSAMRRLGVFGPIGLGFLGETIGSHLGLPPGVSGAAGLGTAALYEWGRNRMRPNPLMERGMGRLGRSGLAPNFPTMPIQGQIVPPEPTAAGVAPPIARQVRPQLTQFAGREPGAPPPTERTTEATGPADERTLARGGGIRQPVRGLLPEESGQTPPPKGEPPAIKVNRGTTSVGRGGRTATKPSPQMMKTLGLKLRGEFPEGTYDFQDLQTGGSLSAPKAGFDEKALIEKVKAHREAMKQTPAEGKSDVAKTKQEAAEARFGEETPKKTDRWTDDPGAIPGEPHAYLDVPEGDIDKAKAVIIEHDTGPTDKKYEARLPDGTTVGRFETGPEARAAAEKHIGQGGTESYSADQIEDAELGIRSELGMREAGTRPGRYYQENEPGEYNPQRERSAAKGVTSGGHWLGVKGLQNLKYTAGFSPTEIETALRRRAGRVYDTLISRAVRSPEEIEKATSFNPQELGGETGLRAGPQIALPEEETPKPKKKAKK